VRYQLLVKNPMEGEQVAPNRIGKRVAKPNIMFVKFDELPGIPEPHSRMVYVAVYSGLRVSELIGLRWNDLGDDCLMMDERFHRVDSRPVKPV
jgi:integrase